MEYTTILYEVKDKAACITPNRPDVLNALNPQMFRDLTHAYDRAETDPEVWVLIITGNGRAPSSGVDVSHMKTSDSDAEKNSTGNILGEPPLSAFWHWEAPQELTPPYLQMTKPIICAVNGICAGAGLDLVTTTDIVIASEDATFFDPHTSIGIVSGREMVRMARVIPLAATLRMALMGKHERMSAQRAYELGLVTEVVPADKLMQRAWEIAGVICRNSPLAVRGTRLAIRKGLSLPLNEAELLAENYREKVTKSEDSLEGPPRSWKGANPSGRGGSGSVPTGQTGGVLSIARWWRLLKYC